MLFVGKKKKVFDIDVGDEMILPIFNFYMIERCKKNSDMIDNDEELQYASVNHALLRFLYMNVRCSKSLIIQNEIKEKR